MDNDRQQPHDPRMPLRQTPPGFERLFAPDGAPADPFADNCAHLDYRTLCQVVHDLSERVTALEVKQA